MEHAMKKLVDENLGMSTVNDISDNSIGFDREDNTLRVLSRDHQVTLCKTKKVIAAQLLTYIA